MDRRGVRVVYDRIAEHFARTRAHPWPAVERFLDDAAEVSTGLDVGCGNGRHAQLLAGPADRVVGVDISLGALKTARDRAASKDYTLELVQGDAAGLPVGTDTVDLAVYVAALHHLPEARTRVASLDELDRVLTPGAPALVSAWSVEHDRFDRSTGFDTTVDWTLPDGETVPRFYHIYDPAEFDRDLAESTLRVARRWSEAGNCYATVAGRG